LQKFVKEENIMNLTLEDSQRKDGEKHSDTMLNKFDEEILLLKMLLRTYESKKEITAREARCP